MPLISLNASLCEMRRQQHIQKCVKVEADKTMVHHWKLCASLTLPSTNQKTSDDWMCLIVCASQKRTIHHVKKGVK